jgi:hypothetical protein
MRHHRQDAAGNFTLSIMFVEPGQGNAAHGAGHRPSPRVL